MKLFAAVALALAVASPAAAQDMASRMQGTYLLGGTGEGDPSCKVTLTDEPAIGGWGVIVGKDCRRREGLSDDVAGWTAYPDGAIGFIDPLRKPILKFTPSQIGGYVSGDLAMARDTGPVKARSPQDRMSGAWSITGLGGEPKCRFTSKAAPGGKSGTLAMKPGCAAKWRDAGWARWKITGGKLALYDAKGAVLQRFDRGDLVTFEGKDAKGAPIYFSLGD